MNLPENGRVVVIDDKSNEALPLLQALAKNKIPSMYFSGNVGELPSETLDNIRVVFLDLKLGISADERIIKSTIAGIFRKIISEKNGPYILVVWSIHEPDYTVVLKDLFEHELIRIKPITMLSLSKTDYFETGGNDEAIAKADALSLIEAKIIEELERIEVIRLLIIWENIVNNSAGKTVNNLSTSYPLDDTWNRNMWGILFELAKAYSGKQLDLTDTSEVIKNALLTFNGTFIDILEGTIGKSDYDYQTDSLDGWEINDEIAADINSKLLLVTDDTTAKIKPGNIYLHTDENLLETFICERIKKNDFLKAFAKQEGRNMSDLVDANKKLKQEYEVTFKTFFDNFRLGIRLVQCEVSPLCDYAQDKWKLHRLLCGIMLPSRYFNTVKSADYIYASPSFKINGNSYKFVFDLRYLTSLQVSELKDKHPEFRIRQELLVDIQAKIAGHINRPGIVSL